jgi:hypothetical protein
VRESRIHSGRKRIDISYTNNATEGFFSWVIDVHGTPAAIVAVECKNYGASIGNPEFDQLTGRFSPRRGRLGFLCHRGFNSKADVIQRCRDAALDDRGYIIALDDSDIKNLVEARKAGDRTTFAYLLARFRELV